MVTAEEEYVKNPELSKEDVKVLQEWVASQPHLPKISEVEVIFFLQSCRSNMETAKNAIENYYTLRTSTPEMYGNKDPLDPDFQRTVSTMCIAFLPGRTKEGYKVSVCKLVDPRPESYVFALQGKYYDMMYSLHLHQEGTSKGFLGVMDMTGASLGHLTRMNMSLMKKNMFYVQHAMPVRLVGIHYINVTPLLDKLMAIVKPFMNKELFSLIHIHTKMETLHQYVPQEMLPQDFGGKGDSMAVLHEKTKQMLLDNVEFFKEENLKVTDESKRPQKPTGSKSSFFGLNKGQNFKNLELD